MYNKLTDKSIQKNRHEVRESDMNILTNPNITYHFAGLFTSDKEWIHPDRTEDTYEIICVTKGEVYMNDNGTEYCVKKGQCLLMYPDVRHYGSRTSSDVSFYWVHFRTEKDSFPIPSGLYTEIENLPLFKELLHLANLPKYPEYAVNAVLTHILTLFYMEYEKNSSDSLRLAEEIYEWIRINADAELCAKKVSEHFGFCPDHITRILRESTGMGTRELTDKFIISRAKELLCNTGKYIKEISADLKFPSDKAFVAFFKYHEGIYPSKFRDRFTQIHMNNH